MKIENKGIVLYAVVGLWKQLRNKHKVKQKPVPSFTEKIFLILTVWLEVISADSKNVVFSSAMKNSKNYLLFLYKPYLHWITLK